MKKPKLVWFFEMPDGTRCMVSDDDIIDISVDNKPNEDGSHYGTLTFKVNEHEKKAALPDELIPLEHTDFEGISRARADYQTMCEYLKKDEAGFLIELIQAIVDREGANKAWKHFPFDKKLSAVDSVIPQELIKVFKNAFRYMEFTSPNKIFGESI